MTVRGTLSNRRSDWTVNAPRFIARVIDRKDMESALRRFVEIEFDDGADVTWDLNSDWLLQNAQIRVTDPEMLYQPGSWKRKQVPADLLWRRFLQPQVPNRADLAPFWNLLEEFGPLEMPPTLREPVAGFGWSRHAGWEPERFGPRHLEKVVHEAMGWDDDFWRPPTHLESVLLPCASAGTSANLRLPVLMAAGWHQWEVYRLYHAAFSCWLRLLEPMPQRWLTAPTEFRWGREQSESLSREGGVVIGGEHRGWRETGKPVLDGQREAGADEPVLSRLTDLQAPCPLPLQSLWWARGLLAPATVGRLLETLTTLVNEAARQTGPSVEVTQGDDAVGPVAPDFLSVLCEQMITYINDAIPVRECARTDCEVLFIWQEGRAVNDGRPSKKGLPTRNQRRSDSRYCSKHCAAAMATRSYRERKRQI